jgi:MFS family permease
MVLGHGEADKSLQTEQSAQGSQAQVRRAAWASAIGTTIEWYDFFLYNTAATLIFPALFFPESSDYAGTMEAFGTYFVGFAARPIGAALFGAYGDRIGRKATLIITLVLMGTASGIIGLLPGTATLGAAGPLLLVLLRILQGVAVGGEWSGSVLLSMEWGNQKKRGLLGSFAQVGVPIGLVLGTGGMTLVSALLPEDAFASWGWRIPFLFSFVLMAFGLFIRLKILETPMFAAVVRDKRTVQRPILEVIKRHPKEILLSAGLRFSEQMPFYLFTSFVLAYLTKELTFSKTFALSAVLVAAALELITIPYFAHLSDRVGRKRLYSTGAILVAVLAFPYFALLNTGVAVVAFIVVVISLVPHAMHYGPQAALISESFPTNLRYGGAGLGYQLASVFAGGPAPLVATFLLEKAGTPYAISGFILLSAVVTLLCTWYLPDRSKSDISDDAIYARAR